jgi:PEP-CTERM motif
LGPSIAAADVFLISDALNNGDTVQVNPAPDGSFQLLVGLAGESFAGIGGLRTDITLESPTLQLASVALPASLPGLLLTANPVKPTVLFLTPADLDPGTGSLPLFLVNLKWADTAVQATSFAMLIRFEGFVEETEEEFSIPRQANLVLTLTPVPEPSTVALLLAGLGAFGLRRLQKRLG